MIICRWLNGFDFFYRALWLRNLPSQTLFLALFSSPHFGKKGYAAKFYLANWSFKLYGYSILNSFYWRAVGFSKWVSWFSLIRFIKWKLFSWAPHNYYIIEGLRKSTSTTAQEQAFKLANQWILENLRIWQNTGRILEFYDVTGKIADIGEGDEAR